MKSHYQTEVIEQERDLLVEVCPRSPKKMNMMPLTREKTSNMSKRHCQRILWDINNINTSNGNLEINLFTT
jgi:hypothetical protein